MITHGHPPSMWVLRDDGVRLVREGVTTPEEVLRVTRA
jgi:type II secretory ATPase GspE/PulE/Tfp pilus assembly ATPase PilB-like protein